jgi:hypothetical protein
LLDWHGRLNSNDWVTTIPDLSKLSHAEKDALILALFARLTEAQEKIAALARISHRGHVHWGSESAKVLL